MNKVLPPDQSERDKILTLLDKNLLVEAGAGSGKTSSLVGRMLAQIMAGNYSVSELAAVTFTRKAAAELRARFQNQLELEFRQAKDPVVKARLEAALADLDQCFLGTIHAFCGKLLRERPLEAGLDPNFKEIDEVQNRLLQDQAWQSYLRTTTATQLAELEALGVTPKELRGSFAQLCCYTDVEIVTNPVEKPDLPACVAKVTCLVAKAKTAVPAIEPAKGYDTLQKAILKAERQLHYLDLSRDISLVRVLKNFDKEPKITQNRWNSAAEAKQYRDEFWTLAEEHVGPTLQQWREHCYYYLLQFVVPAVEHFEALRAKLCCLNFDDLLARTALMLANNGEVRQYFQAKYRCLLIDEFQDTDPLQAEIMFYLTGLDTGEKDWQKLVPRPGSLFVVGDPKQSIYRFRRADIDIYNLVKKLILVHGGECLSLVANFRSVQRLGDWFNPTFSELLPKEGDLYQAEFREMCTMQPNTEGTECGVRVLEIPLGEDNAKQGVVEQEAELIASCIKGALAGKAQPGDFMILTRYKDLMDVYARALQSYGIPVAIAGGSSLQELYELQELDKLLRLLTQPEAEVLLVAVLRGLFFGVSDAELYQFKLSGGQFNFLAPVEVSGQDRIAFAFERLKQYYDWAQRLAPAVVLENIIADLGLIPYVLQLEAGLNRCSYLYQALERVRWWEASGVLAFDEMVAEFSALLSGNVEEELNMKADEQNAVRIMNLHKSKGLEAEVVFLAHPMKKTEARVNQHIKRTGSKPQGYFLISKAVGFQQEVLGQPLAWAEHAEEEAQFLAAEEARLLYVAATRAKKLLVVSRSLKDLEMKKNPWRPLLQQLGEECKLSVPEVDRPAADSVGKTMVAMPQVDEQVWVQQLAKPGFVQTTPSGLKAEAEISGVKRLAGGGMAWGTAVHRVLEKLVQGSIDLEADIELALVENGLELERSAELQEVLAHFQASSIYQELQETAVRYTEVPFSLPVDRTAPLWQLVRAADEVPVVLNGVIDLVYQGATGWEIVDYKTDRVVDEADMQQLVSVYARQVEIYCQVWEQLTGEVVKQGRLYFTDWQGGKEFRVR